LRYLGGKSRIAKHLVEVMRPDVERVGGWWDPFCGGLSVSVQLAAIAPGVALDICLPLIALYEAVRRGWKPPTTVTREEWQTLHVDLAALPRVRILWGDFLAVSPIGGIVVYCDPPYANTTGYKGAPPFDHAVFWRRAVEWARAGAVVYVSEYRAPDGIADVVWERSVARTVGRKVAAGSPDAPTERLFKVRA